MRKVIVTFSVVMLLALLAVGVYWQVGIPQHARQFANEYPEVESLVVPYSTAAIVVIAIVQVGLVALCRLLMLVSGRKRRTPAALNAATVLLACVAGATVLTFGVCCYMAFGAEVSGPQGIYLVPLVILGSILTVAMYGVRWNIASHVTLRRYRLQRA